MNLLLSSQALRVVDGAVLAVVGSALVILATVLSYIFRDGPFSWLTTTAVVLLYVKGLFVCFAAYHHFTTEPTVRWHNYLSPTQWKLSAIGFGLVSLLFAISAIAEEGDWLIVATLVYGALAYGCLVAANKPV